jgi:hypothetical protein
VSGTLTWHQQREARPARDALSSRA